MTPAWFSIDDVAAKTHPPTGWRQVLRAFADLKPEAMHVVIKPGFSAEAQDIEGRWQICDPVLFPRIFTVAGNLLVAPDRPERTRADCVLSEMLLADDVNEPVSIMNPLTDIERGWEIRTTDRLSPSAVRFTESEVRQILERLGGKVEHGTVPAKPRERTLARPEVMAATLDKIEADAKGAGVPLDRSNWPGTKTEFRTLIHFMNPSLGYDLPTDDGNLSDLLRPLGVKFSWPGRSKDKGLKIYREIYPEFPA